MTHMLTLTKRSTGYRLWCRGFGRNQCRIPRGNYWSIFGLRNAISSIFAVIQPTWRQTSPPPIGPEQKHHRRRKPGIKALRNSERTARPYVILSQILHSIYSHKYLMATARHIYE